MPKPTFNSRAERDEYYRTKHALEQIRNSDPVAESFGAPKPKRLRDQDDFCEGVLWIVVGVIGFFFAGVVALACALTGGDRR